MNPSFIALLSIIFGIIGANFYGFRKGGMDLMWNTTAGVFGSVLSIKIVGRAGFDPASIVIAQSYVLLVLNLLTSMLGGVIGLIMLRWFRREMENEVSPTER